MELFCSEIFWSALSAIGTIGAVIVALWQILKPKKRKLVVNTITSEYFDIGRFEFTATVDNVGDSPVIIKECGFAQCLKNNGYQHILNRNRSPFTRVKYIDISLNEHLKNKQFPKMVKAGESVLIEYSYNVPDFEVKDGTLVTRDKTVKTFRTALFVVRDSLTKEYFKNKWHIS